MAFGTVLFARPDVANVVDDFIEQARQAHEVGVGEVWVAQQFDHDAITLAGLIGAAVPGLRVGTSVVPFNPRHPLTVASQAQTAQAASHGHFSLGLGLGSHVVERDSFGIDPPDTIGRLREYLTILRSVFDTGTVDFAGSEFTARPPWPVHVAGGTPVPVLVAAMGPKALQVAGELADGTLPYLAGPRTIADFIAPRITQAAADAGRASPKIVALIPVQLSHDVVADRAAAAQQLDFYTTIPSYRNVIAREGVAHVADLAAIGDADAIAATIARYFDAGATDIVFSPLDRTRPDERLWELLGSLP